MQQIAHANETTVVPAEGPSRQDPSAATEC
jgi:hypothetical protein